MIALQVGQSCSLGPRLGTFPVPLPDAFQPQQQVSRQATLPPAPAASEDLRDLGPTCTNWRKSPNSQSTEKTATVSHLSTSLTPQSPPRGADAICTCWRKPPPHPEAQIPPTPIGGNINACTSNHLKTRWVDDYVRIHSTA